jgi:hypothetical protein
MEKVVDSDLCYRSDCLQKRMRHRYARTSRRQIDFSRLVLRYEFSLWNLFRHGQNRVPKPPYRMEAHTLALAPERVLAERIDQETPRTEAYGTRLANARGN